MLQQALQEPDGSILKEKRGKGIWQQNTVFVGNATASLPPLEAFLLYGRDGLRGVLRV